MKNDFAKQLKTLQQIAGIFGEPGVAQQKITRLQQLGRTALPAGKALVTYHDLLLFFCAYADNARVKQTAERELKRVTAFLQKASATRKAAWADEGLPFTTVLTRFSPQFLHWLLAHKDVAVEFDSFYNPALSLNEVLNITLPTLLKAETTAGLNNEDLLETLGIPPEQYVSFILAQLEKLKGHPLLTDLFIEKLDVYVKLVPRNARFSRSWNRIPARNHYYHNHLLKQFSATELLNTPVPSAYKPAAAEQEAVLLAVKNAMALTVREIDPATFTRNDTLRIVPLERGLQLAVYTLTPERQLPLETYWGFTFFKNGLPVSYGGIWVFGRRMRIGLNIFEPYRGGESGYILCQLMRVFYQLFGVRYFEVEPYQFGLDNPGGIRSGAFWFYYKFGFRPVNEDLRKLAENEYRKIKSRPGYRSPEKILLRFTEGNIALNLDKKLQPDVLDITARVLRFLKKNWAHNYQRAKDEAMAGFCNRTGISISELSVPEKNVLEETALWAAAFGIRDELRLQAMRQMVFTKATDEYACQQALLAFFKH